MLQAASYFNSMFARISLEINVIEEEAVISPDQPKDSGGSLLVKGFSDDCVRSVGKLPRRENAVRRISDKSGQAL